MIEKILPSSLKQFEGIILFIVVLFTANYFWKFSFSGDDFSSDLSVVTFWGMDCTAIFNAMIYHIASVSHFILEFFGYSVVLDGTNITHYNGQGIVVIWGCSGLKQSFIFLCIMLFARGDFKHKLWYALLGLVIVYLVNVSRVTLLAMLVENYRHHFDFMHDVIFKYLFYFIIFMIWLLWEEKLVDKLQKKSSEENDNDSL